MSSVDTVTNPATSDEWRMRDLAAEIKLEISSYLDIHGQLAMRKQAKLQSATFPSVKKAGRVWSVCSSWRSNLSQVLLSKYIDMDFSKMLEQSENQEKNCAEPLSGEQYNLALTISDKLLKHALNIHLQKRTRVLVIRRVDFNWNKSAIVANVIRAKGTALIQLIFKDCEVHEAFYYRWKNGGPFVGGTPLQSALMSATKKLIVDNCTIRNVLGGAFMSEFDMIFFNMPGCPPIHDRSAAGNMYNKLPIVLPRLKLDCSKTTQQLFHSFIMAVDAQCPPVSPMVREEVAHMCSLWSKCDSHLLQLMTLGILVKCFNEGKLLTEGGCVIKCAPLRHLDPLTLNRLTTELLHRMYCFPPDGVVYPRPVDSEYENDVVH